MVPTNERRRELFMAYANGDIDLRDRIRNVADSLQNEFLLWHIDVSCYLCEIEERRSTYECDKRNRNLPPHLWFSESDIPISEPNERAHPYLDTVGGHIYCSCDEEEHTQFAH